MLSEQGNLLQNPGSLPYFKLFCIVSKQIEDKKDLKLYQHNQSMPIAIQIGQNVENKEKPIKSPLQSVSTAFKPFNGVGQQDLFAQEDCQSWRPPNIVNKKHFTSQSLILFKNLKKKSSYRHMIPINTMVLARYDKLTIWPGKIINVRLLQLTTETKYKKVRYDVELINKNRIQRQLRNHALVEFNEETVGMLREFAKNDKQLLKALKVAEKHYQQVKVDKRKWRGNSKMSKLKEKMLTPKIVQNIILKELQHQKYPKLQESSTTDKAQQHDKNLTIQQFVLKQCTNKKSSKEWQTLNLIIQTPKVSLSYFSQQQENQSDSQPQIQNQDGQSLSYKNSVDKFYKYQDCNETYFSEYDQNGIQIDKNRNTKDFSKEKILDKVVKYLVRLKPRVEKQPKKSRKYGKINLILDLLDRPLSEFNESEIQKYSRVVKLSIQISLKELSPSQHNNKTLMKELKQKLCHLYLTLKKNNGTQVFINGLSQTIIVQLENFYDTVIKEIKI